MKADAKLLGHCLGLAQVPSTSLAWGEHEGYPMQIALVRDGNANVFKLSAAWDGAGKEADLRARMEARGVKGKRLVTTDGLATLVVRPGFFGMPDMVKVLPDVHAFVEELRSVAPAAAKKCSECGSLTEGAPVLLRGTVGRVCPPCLERLGAEAAQEQRDYASRTANLAMAALFALAAGAAGGALYGGVMVATNRMFWILGVVTGLMVGYAAAKGAGKSTPVVQGIAAVVTVAAVLSGLLAFVGWQVHQQAMSQGNEVDWMRFVQGAPEILIASGSDALFSLAAGLFGAYRAIRFAAPPQFERVQGAPQ